MSDTIAAISTALGVGAISIIRISGDKAIEIANRISSKDLSKKATHTITYAYIKDNNSIIDEVLISIMRAPKTFTKEDVVEINCHGGIATTKKVLELLIENGCRLAMPGEFTKRAFLNGRIDLTESQAVMDLINTKSESARKIAINNLRGITTKKIKDLRKRLLDIISNIEVNIDYPEYKDIEVVTIKQIKETINKVKKELDTIIINSENSKIIKDGIDVAIIGRPNVGKSSILNSLLGEEKAIVTDIAGTTRDTIEASITFDGIILNLIDTAGIRKATDKVEQIGVDKSLEALDNADLILLVLNNNEKLTKEDIKLLELVKTKNCIIMINKDDLKQNLEIEKIKSSNIIYTNTINDNGLAQLKEKIKEMFNLDSLNKKDFNYVSNIESISKLKESRKIVDDIEKEINDKDPIDMIEIDIKNIWNILGEIIGETYSEEMLDNLFKNFCVGK